MLNFKILLALVAATVGFSAYETGPADSIMRVPHSGNLRPKFGSIDLSQSAAVGSSKLPIANGGTGPSLTLPIANGGTGITGGLTNGQIPIGETSDGLFTFSTVTGTSDGVTVTNGAHSITLDVASPAAASISSTAIDWSTLVRKGGFYTKTLSANTTFTFSNVVVGCINVRLTNTASNYTVTWPGSVAWANSSAPTMTTGATKSDVYGFCYDGTNTMGFVAGQAFPF